MSLVQKPEHALYIFTVVAAIHGVTVDEIVGHRRHENLVQARRDVARWLRQLGLSYPAIGRMLGGRHHASIMNLCGWKRSEEAQHAIKVRYATRAEVRAA